MVRTTLLFGLIAVAGALESSAQAQSTSLFGSSGPRANSTTASRASSSSSASSMSQSAGLSGSTGTSGTRASGAAGGTGAGGDAFQGPQLGEIGALSAQAAGNGTGFVGANNGAFVGNRMAGTSGMSTMQLPSFGALGGGSDFNSQNQSQQGVSATRNFRPRFRVAFEYTPSASTVSQRASATMTRLTTRNPALAGLQINVDDAGMAEIRGTAPNAEARTLIENVVRLEPGVRGVTNLIVVAPPAAANP